MLTVFRILYGINVKIGKGVAENGRSLPFLHHISYKNSYRRFISKPTTFLYHDSIFAHAGWVSHR
ncbi:hypothetical protein BleG1_0118 [Shouchella lehensis G1]|uniref:Uncharacterized protein n=1 Tax=Shouchella lehensis G1 TaxID=1246626 RepID=A0A060LWR1_9BACI|nr:hypothetical protein BleG1_0118 [Shouchella lehensis G1]